MGCTVIWDVPYCTTAIAKYCDRPLLLGWGPRWGSMPATRTSTRTVRSSGPAADGAIFSQDPFYRNQKTISFRLRIIILESVRMLHIGQLSYCTEYIHPSVPPSFWMGLLDRYRGIRILKPYGSSSLTLVVNILDISEKWGACRDGWMDGWMDGLHQSLHRPRATGRWDLSD